MEHDTSEKNKPLLGDALNQVLAALEPLDDLSRGSVLLAVCHQLGIEFPGSGRPTFQPGGAGGALQPASVVPAEGRSVADIRSFAEAKRPSSANERAVLVAYYLSELAPEAERKDVIEKEDLVKYFKQAGFPLPTRPEQTLVNAKHAGYLDSVGEGKYRLNSVGHNLIAHNLPRRRAEQKRIQRSRPRKRAKHLPRASE
jgi:hypothetical protein